MFNAIMVGLMVMAAIALVVWLANPKSFRRVREAFSAQLGRAGHSVWASDPEAIFQQRAEKAAEELNESVGSLEAYKAHIIEIQRYLAEKEAEKARLSARIKTYLSMDQRDKAGQDAIALSRVNSSIGDLSEKLVAYQTSYQAGLQRVTAARNKIVELKQRGKELGAELKMSKSEAALSNAAAKLSSGIANPDLDNLAEIEHELQEQISKNRAKAQVARDLGTDGLNEIEFDKEVERTKAEELLRQFEANPNA